VKLALLKAISPAPAREPLPFLSYSIIYTYELMGIPSTLASKLLPYTPQRR
jgi:hypothetical protein